MTHWGAFVLLQGRRSDLIKIIWHDSQERACLQKDSKEEDSSGLRLPVKP